MVEPAQPPKYMSHLAFRLGLEDPSRYAAKVIRESRERRIRELGDRRAAAELYRGTGRTMRTKLAMVHALENGQEVMIVANTVALAHDIAEHVQEMCRRLEIKHRPIRKRSFDAEWFRAGLPPDLAVFYDHYYEVRYTEKAPTPSPQLYLVTAREGDKRLFVEIEVESGKSIGSVGQWERAAEVDDADSVLTLPGPVSLRLGPAPNYEILSILADPPLKFEPHGKFERARLVAK